MDKRNLVLLLATVLVAVLPIVVMAWLHGPTRHLMNRLLANPGALVTIALMYTLLMIPIYQALSLIAAHLFGSSQK